MILHLFIDSALFTSLPDDIITISLKFSVDRDKSLDVTSSVAPHSETVISKTLHIPLLDDVATTSAIEIEAVAYSVDGRSVVQGSGATSVSPIEHGVAKQVALHDGHGTTGTVKFSVYYYRFPMDINDFQHHTDDKVSATAQQQLFMKEYAFLQKRRMHWGDDKPSSWNSTSERLLAEDTSVASERDLALLGGRGRGGQQHISSFTHINEPASSPRNRTRTSRSRSRSKGGQPPKLRQTCLSVSYGGMVWPSNPGDQEEKLLTKLHVAEQKRLQLLHAAAEQTRQRNVLVNQRIASIQQSRHRDRDSVSRQEHHRLQDLLQSKEESLRALQAELRCQRSTHRKARPLPPKVACAPPFSSARRRGSGKGARNLRGSEKGGGKAVAVSRKHRHPPPPSYLAPTSCWSAKTTPITTTATTNCQRQSRSRSQIHHHSRSQSRSQSRSRVKSTNKSKAVHSRAAASKGSDRGRGRGRERGTASLTTAASVSPPLPSCMTLPLDVFHHRDPSSPSSSCSWSVEEGLETASSPTVASVDDILANKSATAISLLKQLQHTQSNLASAPSSALQMDKDSHLNTIIQKYSNSHSHGKTSSPSPSPHALHLSLSPSQVLDVSVSPRPRPPSATRRAGREEVSLDSLSEQEEQEEQEEEQGDEESCDWDSLTKEEAEEDEAEEDEAEVSSQHVLFSGTIHEHDDDDQSAKGHHKQPYILSNPTSMADSADNADSADSIYCGMDEIALAIQRLQGRMVAGANLDHDDTEDTCNNKGEYQQQQEEEEAAGGRRDRDKDRDRDRAAGGDAIEQRLLLLQGQLEDIMHQHSTRARPSTNMRH